MMEIFWILWFFILPIIGIVTPILALIIWFVLVPKVARMLTWNRFKNISIHAVADQAGYIELLPTKESLPEGIERTKKGWRFLPKPIWKGNPGEETSELEQLALRKYILKDYGKPFWIGHAGKVTAMNPGTVAALQQDEKPLNVEPYIEDVENFAKDIPQHFYRSLKPKLKKLRQVVSAKEYTLIDIDKIKELVTKMYPPSLIDALATNRELKGMRKRKGEYMPIILGGMIIVGIIAFTVIVLVMAK